MAFQQATAPLKSYQLISTTVIFKHIYYWNGEFRI